MAASKHNLSIDSGATFRTQVIWKDSNNQPINLTTATARMQIRKKVDSVEIMLELTTENGGISLGGALGTIDIYMTDLQTETLSAGVYDLEVSFPVSGYARPDVVRLLYGSINVSKNVTRSI